MNFLNTFLFVVLPYMAVFVFLVGTIYRYHYSKFVYSSLSSQFLESRKLFYGSQAFHWGVILLFFGHLVGFLFPKSIIALNSQPARILIIEITALIAGFITLTGMILLILRRLINSRLRKLTTTMDWILEGVLLFEILFGIAIAFSHRWGSAWFAAVITPYIKSVFTLNPDIQAVSAAPWMIKVHITGFYLLLILFPFTRLVHVLVYPLRYIWRPFQRVIWNM
ncbi:MAG: respiratory nitrate reductase subunit gamma [Bacteroidales bacterium]|nr:respiratory nitrate reductase subunit gamma [Bacteroidales bacterium]